jgi:hypothetical protein
MEMVQLVVLVVLAVALAVPSYLLFSSFLVHED